MTGAAEAGVACKGFVIGNGDGSKYRTMVQGMPEWTSDVSKAIHFARRQDAEMFCEEDEDAWHVYPIVTHDRNAPSLRQLASALVRDAERAGLVVSIWQHSMQPFAMGHYVTFVEVREARIPTPEVER